MKRLLFLLLLLIPPGAMAQVNVLILTRENVFSGRGSLNVISTRLQNALMNNGYRCLALKDSAGSDFRVTVNANSRQGNTVRNFCFAYVDATLTITGKENLSYTCDYLNVKGGSTDYTSANLKAYAALATMVTDSTLKFFDKRAVTPETEPPVAKTTPKPASDVDLNIPVTSRVNADTYVVAIGNEDYSSYQTGLNNESNVEGAVNDATIFSRYCIQTLGVPEKNVVLRTNATLGQMRQAIMKLVTLTQLKEGKASLIFYYSGHGLPDEETHDPYLIPVDISGSDVKSAISLEGLFKDLTRYPAKKVTVILDACFSGGARNQGLIALKGVKVKPKESTLTGNLVVMSSSSADESSTVYKEKGHGMFTYFLLKKLQETKGNVSYKILFDDISTKVRVESVTINNKNQTPQISGSPEVQQSWESWRFLD